MSDIFTDPTSGRHYRVDPATGQSVWVDESAPPAAPVPQAPAPPPPGTPVGGQYPVPPRKKHPVRTILLAIGGVIAVIAVISVIAGRGSTSSGGAADDAAGGAAGGTETTAGQTAKPSPKTAGMNTAVRDGKFEFTVTKVKSGVSSLGDEYLNTKAQGQFVLITVKVENIGTEPQMFDGGNQYLYDSQDREFEASSEAAVYLGDDADSLLNNINPGNTVTAVVVFDVPKNIKLKKVKLHDSMFSGGVEVSLA